MAVKDWHKFVIGSMNVDDPLEWEKATIVLFNEINFMKLRRRNQSYEAIDETVCNNTDDGNDFNNRKRVFNDNV